jgi:glycosyltransferase involved in cell wall biosynthesis
LRFSTKDKKCIGYYAPFWPVSAGANGIVTYVDTMIKGLEYSKWSPIIVTTSARTDPDNGSNSVKVYSATNLSLATRVARKLGWQVHPGETIATAFAKLSRRENVQLIEIEESFGFANRVMQCLPTPVIVRLHGPWFLTGATAGERGSSAISKRVEQEGRAIGRAAGVSAPSRFVLEAVRNFYQLDLPDARVIPNPVSRAVHVGVQLPVNIPEGSRVVLYVGRFEPLKGGDLAIDAFARIARDYKDVHFLFVGPDNGLQSSLQTTAEHYACNAFESGDLNRFHFLGRQSPEIVASCRARASVVTVTSRFENFPLSLIEAMSEGCPSVATSVGGIPEIIEHGDTGILVEPTSESIASGIQQVLNNPNQAAERAAKAKLDVKSRFSTEQVVADSIGFYESVLKR